MQKPRLERTPTPNRSSAIVPESVRPLRLRELVRVTGGHGGGAGGGDTEDTGTWIP